MYCLTAAKSVRALSFIKTVIVLFIMAVPFCSRAQPVSKTFDEAGSGTYTVPTGYRAKVKIQVWGGGGAAGSGTILQRRTGGGGGGYAEVEATLPPGTYAVTVGAGGTPGNAGGASQFSSLTGYIRAGGGSSAAELAPGGSGSIDNTGSWVADNTFKAYSGGNGVKGQPGGGAGSGGPGGAGGNGGTNGVGGTSGNTPAPAGTGGNAGVTGANGENGNVPGGGGGGITNSVAFGGSGANGQVMVTVLQSLPLPVTFGTIDAALTADKVLTVDFVTLAETNNDHFNIELSADGEKFEKIATIQSRRPHQLYNGATTYQFKGSAQGGLLAGALVMMGIGLLSTARRHRRLALAVAVLVTLSVSLSCSRPADALPDANHKLYLRIQQVDVDRQSAYSKVILVKTQDRQ